MMDQDFQHAPWKCEIQINKYTCMILFEGKINEAIFDLNNIIINMTKHNCLDKHVAQIHALLSIGYQMLGNKSNSQKSIESAVELMKNKSSMPQYKQTVITTKLAFLFMCLQTEQYEIIVQEGKILLEDQKENNLYERIHYTFFLLAMANYNLGEIVQAVKYCKNVIYTTLIHEKPYDVKNFLVNKSFIELINCNHIDRRMVKEFCCEYQIDPQIYQINI